MKDKCEHCYILSEQVFTNTWCGEHIMSNAKSILLPNTLNVVVTVTV